MSHPRFHDASVRPPRSGWHYPINGQFVQEYSESAIINRIKQYEVNNGTFISDEDISQRLWAYLCQREPLRCGPEYVAPAPNSPEAASIPGLGRDLNPKIYGPWLWNMLHFEAVRFDRPSFLHLCNRMVSLIECPECRNEWSEILRSDSPQSISTSAQAAAWSLKQHNRVSAKLGKQQWSWQQFIAEYGNPQ